MADVNVGAAANDGTGDPLRQAFIKVNQNDQALSARIDGILENGGKLISSRAQAISMGQAKLPDELGRIVVFEGAYFTWRGPGQTEDQLFTSYPNWGVVDRIPTRDGMEAAIAALQTEVRDGRVYFRPALIDPSGVEIPTWADLILARHNATNTDRRWANIGAPSNGLETDDVKQDANGRWWIRVRDAGVAPAIRDSGILETVNIGGTGDAITAELAPSMTEAGVGSIGGSSEVSYRPVATNTASNPTISIGGQTFQIRGADGETWPANGFVVGRFYKMRRTGNALRVVSGDATLSEVTLKADRQNSGKTFNTRQAAVDAGQATLLPNYGPILVREGGFLEFRGPNQTSDQLFETYPYWGVFARYPDESNVNAALNNKANLANSGMAFGSRADAVAAGQANIPPASGPLLVRDGDYLELRGPGAGTDPLFETYPNWGLLARFPNTVLFESERSARRIADRDAGILTTSVLAESTGDDIHLELSGAMTGAGIEALSSASKFEYTPSLTNEAQSPNLTIGGATYGVRDAQGLHWPAGGFKPGRTYILRRRNVFVRVLETITANDLAEEIVDATKDKLDNDSPVNTDAGLAVLDRDDNGMLLVDETGTWLAGIDEPVEDILSRSLVPTVAPSHRTDSLDLDRMTALTPASRDIYMQGLTLRGGRCAPMPTFQLPQSTDWGMQWGAQRFVMRADSPRIAPDPFYQQNVGLDEFVHPHVLHFPHKFLGYEYLLCMNPYPGGSVNDDLENPILYGSDNMIDWHLFTHFPQPLSDASSHGDYVVYLSDSTLFYDPLYGELVCLWRVHRRGINVTHYEYRTTLDGVHWSETKRTSFESDVDGTTSPAFAYNSEERKWYVYTTTENMVTIRTVKDFRNLDADWEVVLQTDLTCWHLEARVIGERVWLFLNWGPFNNRFRVFRSEPNDWTSFTLVHDDLLNVSNFRSTYGSGAGTTYKNTFVPHLYEDGTANMKAIIQCKPDQTTWWLFFAETERLPIIDV